jgi:hypothetical protein
MTKSAKPKTKVVMFYSHYKEDRDFLNHSQLLTFLKNLGKGFEFWWDEEMDEPLWDDEIKGRIEEADIIIWLVSESFLASGYVSHVEAPMSYKRLIGEGVLIVPIMLNPSSWKEHAWLRKIHHYPTDKPYLHGHPNKNQVYLDIVKYIRRWIGKRGPIQDPEMIGHLRRLPEHALLAVSNKQIKSLVKDSCDRARGMVNDARLRARIVKAAKAMKGKDKKRTLSKEELAQLDEQFLAGGTRKPDPKFVRWVLRCARLHPQGSA